MNQEERVQKMYDIEQPRIYGELRIYPYTNDKNKPGVAIFRGRSKKAKAWNYFASEADRAKFLANYMEQEDKRLQAEEERKAARQNFKNPFKVGDILYSSWGYEQTNVDFYQVTKVTAQGVYLEEIGQQRIEGTTCGDSCKVAPNPTIKPRYPTIGGPFFRRVVKEVPRGAVSINSYSNAYKYEGGGVFKSWWR